MDQRYYASSYGRFNTADPMAASANPKNPLSWNRYTYSGSDPVNRFDPSGLVDEFSYPCTVGASEGAETTSCEVVVANRNAAVLQTPPPPDASSSFGGLSLNSLTDFSSALDRAISALRSPDCAALFGLSKNSMDPVSLLNTLVASSGRPSTGVGSIEVTDLNGAAGAQSNWTGAVSVSDNAYYYKNQQGQIIQTSSVTLSIDASSWYLSDADWRSRTLIHELGHIFNMLAGAGGSMFVYDADYVTGRPDSSAEAYNHSLEEKCIP